MLCSPMSEVVPQFGPVVKLDDLTKDEQYGDMETPFG